MNGATGPCTRCASTGTITLSRPAFRGMVNGIPLLIPEPYSAVCPVCGGSGTALRPGGVA